MAQSISEVLESANKLSSKEDKIEYLRQRTHPGLLTVLKAAYCPSWKWVLPEGNPPYKQYQGHDAHGALWIDARKIYLFLEGGNPNLKQAKREYLFIQLIESIMPADAELMLSVKNKKLPYKTLTKKLIKEAFPGLIEEDVEVKETKQS